MIYWMMYVAMLRAGLVELVAWTKNTAKRKTMAKTKVIEWVWR